MNCEAAMQHHDQQPGVPARPPARRHGLNGNTVIELAGGIDLAGLAGELDLYRTVADATGGDRAP
jgi:hypothetical protein